MACVKFHVQGGVGGIHTAHHPDFSPWTPMGSKFNKMKIKIKLYGTLGSDIPDHDPLKGLEIEIADGLNVDDLIDHLAIPRKKVGIISVDGHLAKATKPLHSGNFVRIFMPIFGG